MKKYQLMAPGPTPVPSQVLLAMAQPILHHRTPEYEALFIEVRAGLKRLFQTAQDVLPFASSGTGVMEAAVANTLSAGDEVLLVRAGKFADRFAERRRRRCARRHGPLSRLDPRHPAPLAPRLQP
jgi:aspartate aminotransferase-like enzyme